MPKFLSAATAFSTAAMNVDAILRGTPTSEEADQRLEKLEKLEAKVTAPVAELDKVIDLPPLVTLEDGSFVSMPAGTSSMLRGGGGRKGHVFPGRSGRT
eukprot:g16128.t1